MKSVKPRAVAAQDGIAAPARGWPGTTGLAAAAWLAAALATALLDRAGAPGRLLAFVAPVLACAGLAVLGLSRRSMRISQFYAAGRALSAGQGAMAGAALLLALLVAFAPPRGGAPAWRDVFAAWALGGVLSMLATGPMLRKSGAFSLAGLLAGRFPGFVPRVAALGLAALAGALVFMAGLESAIAVLTGWLGLSRAAAATVASLLPLAICLPGGLGGVALCACAAFGLALAGLAAPLAAHVWNGGILPLPLLGDRAGMWAGLEQLARYSAPGAPESAAQAIAAGLGLAVLAPLAGLAAAQAGARPARRAAFGALAWTGAALALALAAAIIAGAALDAATTGRRPEQLPQAVLAASARGMVPVCGVAVAHPADAQAACAAKPSFSGTLRPGDLAPSPAALLLGAGPARVAGTALSALAAAALLALGLALAAAGLHGLAGALGNDLSHRLRDSAALTSRRLAITRALMLAAAICGGLAASRQAIEPRLSIALATGLSAAFLAPLLLLALWPFATARDAVLGLLAGAGFAALAAGRLAAAPDAEQAARAVLLVAGTVLATGLAASLLHARPRPVSPFPRDLMRGDGDALPPDKGA